MKRQTIDWEKVFVKHISKQGCIPWICNNLLQFNNKKWKDPIENGQDLNRLLIKEDIRIANKHTKRGLPMLVFKDMQIKSTMRCSYTLLNTQN